MKWWGLATELLVQFVKILSMSNFCPSFVLGKCFFMVLSIVLKFFPIFVHIGQLGQILDKNWTKLGHLLKNCLNSIRTHILMQHHICYPIVLEHHDNQISTLVKVLDVPTDQWQLIKWSQLNLWKQSFPILIWFLNFCSLDGSRKSIFCML